MFPRALHGLPMPLEVGPHHIAFPGHSLLFMLRQLSSLAAKSLIQASLKHLLLLMFAQILRRITTKMSTLALPIPHHLKPPHRCPLPSCLIAIPMTSLLSPLTSTHNHLIRPTITPLRPILNLQHPMNRFRRELAPLLPVTPAILPPFPSVVSIQTGRLLLA